MSHLYHPFQQIHADKPLLLFTKPCFLIFSQRSVADSRVWCCWDLPLAIFGNTETFGAYYVRKMFM